jgi:PTH1 family peptidyl-tRNA hydrolase
MSNNAGNDVIRIICGLGNHGQQYERTRHNLGFNVIDHLAEQLDLCQANQADWYDYYTSNTDRGNVYLLKPTTYVNRSGLAVKAALTFWRAQPTELFVISDDFNLSLGSLRIRNSGRAGGHNGLASIIEELGIVDFPRMRIGIGPLPGTCVGNREKIHEFVLNQFHSEEIDIKDKMISRAVEALQLILKGNLDLAISRYNKVNPTPGQ